MQKLEHDALNVSPVSDVDLGLVAAVRTHWREGRWSLPTYCAAAEFKKTTKKRRTQADWVALLDGIEATLRPIMSEFFAPDAEVIPIDRGRR